MYHYGNSVFKVLLITSLHALYKLSFSAYAAWSSVSNFQKKKKTCKETSKGRSAQWFNKLKKKFNIFLQCEISFPHCLSHPSPPLPSTPALPTHLQPSTRHTTPPPIALLTLLEEARPPPGTSPPSVSGCSDC